MAKRSVALLVICLGALLALSVTASADTGDIIEPQNETAGQGFQAGTCIANELGPTQPCSVDTPELFYKVAAGHPPVGFTQYIIQHTTEGALNKIVKPLAGRTIKTLRVDLPPGLTVNPMATPSRCSLAEFLHQSEPGLFVPECDEETKVGEERVTLSKNAEPGEGTTVPPLELQGTKVNVYNLVPSPGEPAKFGFVIGNTKPNAPIFLETEVAWENDFHESFTIKLPVTPAAAEAKGFSSLISRLINFGRSGNGTYITTPTTCFDPNVSEFASLYSTWFRAE